jgi:hypothetical protein
MMSATDDSNSSPAHVSSPASGSGAWRAPISGHLSGKPRREDADHPLPVSCHLSVAGIRFLGILFPPRDYVFLTVDLPRHTCCGDLDGVSTFRTREIRPDRVPSLLRDGGAPTTGQSSPVAACRFPAASPKPRRHIPSPGLSDDEASEDSPTFTRPVFPSPVTPGWSGSPWAPPSSFGPRRHQRRPLRWGQALEHWPGTTRSP